MTGIFCNICQQFDPCIPTPCFTAGNSYHEAVSSNACLKWSQCIRIVQTRIQTKAHKQAHSDLKIGNAGSTESSRTLLSSAKHFWCVEMAAALPDQHQTESSWKEKLQQPDNSSEKNEYALPTSVVAFFAQAGGNKIVVPENANSEVCK